MVNTADKVVFIYRKGETAQSSKSTVKTRNNTNNQNYNKRFEDFWNEYPKRNGSNPRKPAYQKFIKLINDGVCPDKLISAARQYEKWVIHKKQDRQFVKQAITWLNQECWEDNLSIPKNELKEGFGQRIGYTGI